MNKTLRVTFSAFAPSLNKWFTNVEDHVNLADAQLRASALGWRIEKTEAL